MSFTSDWLLGTWSVWATFAGAKLVVAAGQLVKTHQAWVVEKLVDDAASSLDCLSDNALICYNE